MANGHQTRVPSQIIGAVSAAAGHRVLVSMAPSVACAIRVSSALPEASLTNQAYQKVTAMVASGLDRAGAELRHNEERDMPDGDPDGHQHGGGERRPGGCSLGWAQPRKLASSGSWAFMGLTILMAIAIGRPYQTLNSAMFGTGAPKALFRAIAAKVTASGTASGEHVPDPADPPADQPCPHGLQAGHALGQGHDDQRRDQHARGEEALPGKGGPAEGVGEQEESDDGMSPDQGHVSLSVRGRC